MVGRPRKAKVDAEARSMAEPSSEISLPENDDDSDFEEPPVVTKGRKRQKRGDGPAPKRGGGGGGRGRGRKKSGGGGGAAVGGGADDDADSGTGSIFDVVKGGRSSLQSLVDDWIESYKNDRDSALLELIQFFIQGSGCKGKITPYMYANQEHAEIIRRMTEEFDEESGDYPLIMSGPIWKRFRSNFCEFVQVLVRQCQYSIIYDQYMMDNIISLLTGLTDSQVRAFRHTSTLAAMKLMTALVDVALNLSINLDNTQRQYEAERQKQQMKRANDRLDMLLTRRQELEENQAEIRNMLTYIFRGVFVHRYRDTQPEIRSICMTEIGVWMKKYPNMFLDDAYLKYVGWTLYDKIGDVRQCCLRALYPLYETEDLSPKLELFTNRFKDRIVEMTLDKEYDVAVQGIRLVISILRYNDTILSDKDCENVYELVYSSNRQVAQAAGEFLNTKLFLRDYEGPKTLKIHKGKKQSLNAPLIRDLVQFFIESELHEHAAYLVDSLWDINDMMKDWDCMTDLLLDEPQKGEEPLDDRQETSLIEIMVCCVKQAATGESPVGRGHNRKLTAKETKNVSEDKTRLTEHFISTLPQLLLKYLMDPEKVANLLLVPQYFELDIYTASRQEKNLEALLRYLHEVVEKHTDTEVLEACSKCYECLCCEEYAIAGKCDVARKTLIDSLVVKFKEAMQDFFAEGEEPDEDEIFALTASLKRIYAFYSCHNLTSWDLWDDIFSIIKNGNENQTIPDEIVSKAMSSASMSVLWYLQKLDENNPSKDEMKALRKRLNDLLKYCHELMYHPKDRVNEEAFITICDLLIVFSKNMANNDMMKPLVYEPDKNLQQQLSNFLTDKVFVDDEDDDVDENVKIEELHKRRNFLACFCKLIVYNIVGIRVAADMFKHYMKFYNDYGDIIKATLSKAREINKVTTAKTLALSLTQLYREQFADGGPIDRSSDSFQSLKELARRFALSFGLDAVKNREAVAAMHKEGILFSLSRPDDHRDHAGPPPYLTFLEILSEFTNKLMKPDRRVVLAYLDKNLPDGGISSTEDWQSLIAYRNSLLQGESEVHPVTLKQASARRYGKRKQIPDVSDHDSNTGDWQDHSAMTPAPGIGGPQLTSTAVKRRRMDEESLGGASEPGSEQDFEGSGSVQQMTQMSWLNAQKREHLEATYQRMKQSANIPPLESEGSEERSIGEFESPPQLLQQQYQQYQQGYYDNSSQNIEDGSQHPQTPQVPATQSDMSHPGF